MSIDPKEMNKALAEYQAFGSQRQIPVEERWRKILRDVHPDEFAGLKAQCERIEATALALAEQVHDKKITVEAARSQLAQEFPFLSADRLSHTWSQAMYFSLK